MNLQVIKNRLLFWFRKIFLYGLFFAIVFFTLSFILLQFPQVQTALIGRYLSGFSQVIDFPTSVESMDLRWYDRLELRNVKIKDPEHNTMISVGRLLVNFEILSLLTKGNVNIDAADIDHAEVSLIKIHESDTSKNLNINLFIKKINEKFSSGGGGQSSAKLNIGEIALTHSKFNYDDNENDSIKNGFDYYHFNLDVDDGDINAFQVIGDTIQFDVKGLNVFDRQTKLDIKNLSTYFRISQASMEFLNLDLKAGKSVVSDTIIFTYRSQDDLSDDFNGLVNIRAKLKNTVLDPHDLALFTYGLAPLPHPLKLNGEFIGRVSKFNFNKMEVAWGNSKIEGNLSMDGMPNINETFIDLKIKEVDIDQSDIQFLLADQTAKALHPLGKIHARGEFTGFPNDFVARGNLLTQLGKIHSDVNLKINEADVNQSTFSGHVSLDDFKIGVYLNDTINYQRVTLDGSVNGKGLTRENTDFLLTGTIRSFGFRHYNYSNIVTNARFARQLFNGNLSIKDPNLIFRAKAFIDFRKGKELIQVKANLDTAFLENLGFTKKPLFVRSYFDVNTSGLKLDSLFGSVVMRKAVVTYDNETLLLDSVRLISTQEGTDRQLQLRSSIADFVMKGDYRYSTLFSDAQKFGRELYLKINNNRKALADYYQRKKTNTQTYQLSFKLNVRDTKPLAGLGKIDLYLSPGSVLTGDFSHGPVSSFRFNSKMDTVAFKGKIFSNNEIEFKGTKTQDSLELNASLAVRSANQHFTSSFKTKNILAQAQWEKDHIGFNIDADQDGNTNTLRLRSQLDFLRDSIRIKILPTLLRIFDEDWGFSQENYAMMKGNEWAIHRLQVTRGNESAMIDGFISNDPERSLTLRIDSLNLDILNSLVQEKMSGEVNGAVEAKDLYHNPFVQNKVTINNLTVDEFLVGNITGLNLWNRERKRFDLTVSLERQGKRTVEMEGFYDPALASPLNVNAKLENTNIKIIEPFMRGIFSNMDGALTGNYTITGTFLEPVIRGDGKIEAAQLMVDYLKTTYYFTGSLGFSPTQILFNDFILTDGLKNKATLDGFLAHRNYNEFRINLDAAFKNFQVLNTNPKDNSLFYGQAFGTGNLNMLGPISNLKISATARTTKGTRIFIPLNGSMDNTSKKDFITFVNFADTLKLKEEEKKSKQKEELTGIVMDMNLDITPDAYAEIIFDIKTGDIIRGYGNGDLRLQIDTKGDFSMFGAYEFEQGNYNFTLYDIINKEFSINKGSKITWYGDPYEATLAINSSYKQLVSFAPTISTTDQTVINSPQMKRKYPAEVLLKLDGAMMSPQINFDIIAKDLPNNVPMDQGKPPVALNQEFKQFRAKLDEQELKRQVFSLIMLRRFSPPDAFATGGGSTLYSSVSELLSNQLSYWLTQVDQNLEVNFDLGNFDQEAFNTFQLRLSYSFLNGRLRVTRDGVFNNQTNKSEIANMLGDWTVDYLLTPDGKFKVKMYNRTNINQLALTQQTTAITTGFSLMNTQSFNTWRELLTAARNRRKKELEQKPPVAEDGTP